MEDDEMDQRGEVTTVWLPRDDSCESSTNRRLAAAHSISHGENWPSASLSKSGSSEFRRRMSVEGHMDVEGHNFPSSSSLYQCEEGVGLARDGEDVLMEDRSASHDLQGHTVPNPPRGQEIGEPLEDMEEQPLSSRGREPHPTHHREELQRDDLHLLISKEYSRLLGLRSEGSNPEHGMQPETPRHQSHGSVERQTRPSASPPTPIPEMRPSAFAATNPLSSLPERRPSPFALASITDAQPQDAKSEGRVPSRSPNWKD